MVNTSACPLMMQPQCLRYRGFPKQYCTCIFPLMEFVKLVKVELQKISIYLHCNIWI